MGCYGPAGTIDDATMRQIDAQIFVPLLDALVRREVRYRGVLYAGLMLTAGGPKVLEFNCRFGDPETQVILPRLKSDLLEVLDQACRGKLDQVELRWDARAAVCVVMAAPGYPDQAKLGGAIDGLSTPLPDGVFIDHAGTKRDGGKVVTAGGRVLGVTALGDTVTAARARAYAAVETIRFEGRQFRTDIASGVA
jgi:phosphoribosylamine--glycine ligase